MNIGAVSAAKGVFGPAVYKFGFNTEISTDEETVWDGGGIYSYADTAGTVSVVSTSTADDAAGTGARKIIIQGLDADYNQQTVEVALDGTTSVTTTESLIAINRMFVSEAGTGEVNAGNITATIGNAVRSQISADQGQTLQAVYTVPAGFTAYITQWMIGSGATASNKYLDGRLIVRRNAGIIQTKARTTINNITATIELGSATIVNEKDSIEVRAFTSSGTDAVSGTFTLILEKN